MLKLLPLLLPLIIGLLTGQVNATLGWVVGGALFILIAITIGFVALAELDREDHELERLGRINPITVLLSNEEADRLRRLRTRHPEPPDPFNGLP